MFYLPTDDRALSDVAWELRRLDPTAVLWGAVIRRTYDMVYNGRETGRYRWDQLMKTEKTHFGSLFEINAQRAFGFCGGDKLDFRIVGHEVDAKWSQSAGGWMLPPEVFGELALVATADDARSIFSLGLVRVTENHRRESANRDLKTSLNGTGRDAIHWLWRDAPFPPNVLLQLPADVVQHIFDHRDGTQRLHRLFRAAEGLVVHRTTVETVAQQLDSQKRVRGNGGSRSVLAAEGYLILSGKWHRHVAEALEIPLPTSAEYISVRVAPSAGRDGAFIAGKRWRRAEIDEVIQTAAPVLPERGAREDSGDDA